MLLYYGILFMYKIQQLVSEATKQNVWKVTFNIKGRYWNRKYMNVLQTTKIFF